MMEFSAKQIAELINGVVVGDPDAKITSVSKIEEGMPGTISFLSNIKYTKYIYDTEASVVLVNKSFVPEHEVKATMIKVDDAYVAVAKLMQMYENHFRLLLHDHTILDTINWFSIVHHWVG